MDAKSFEAVLTVVVSALADTIMTKTGLPEDAALVNLYGSALYASLENEETKVWQYSVPMLYELYKSENANGELVLPEY